MTKELLFGIALIAIGFVLGVPITKAAMTRITGTTWS